jgi:hypothetical protein
LGHVDVLVCSAGVAGLNAMTVDSRSRNGRRCSTSARARYSTFPAGERRGRLRTSPRAAPNSIVSRLQSEDGGSFFALPSSLYAGNILICTGIFLMHGNKWTVLFGTLTYVLLLAAIVRAEEAHLLQAFGSAYEDCSRRIPRSLPRRASWSHALRMQAKRGKIAITGKGKEAIVWTNPCPVP